MVYRGAKGDLAQHRRKLMSKRKKEIKKRKKVTEEDPRSDDHRSQGPALSRSDDAAARAREDALSSGDVPTIAAPAEKKPARVKTAAPDPPGTRAETDSWFGRNRENFLLGLLIFYVLLLGLGTVGELFEIEWILNLPLFR